MGRKRRFDCDDALDVAMRLFWERGYAGTSIGDLTLAMGIKRPSLYNVFGSKERLFRLALRRYERTRLGFMWRALRRSTVRAVIGDFLDGLLDLVTGSDTPKGAFDINAAIACSAGSERVRLLLVSRRTFYRRLLRRRFHSAQEQGELGAAVQPEVLAHLVLMLGGGLALQAKAGVSRPALEKAIKLVLVAIPVANGQSSFAEGTAR